MEGAGHLPMANWIHRSPCYEVSNFFIPLGAQSRDDTYSPGKTEKEPRQYKGCRLRDHLEDAVSFEGLSWLASGVSLLSPSSISLQASRLRLLLLLRFPDLSNSALASAHRFVSGKNGTLCSPLATYFDSSRHHQGEACPLLSSRDIFGQSSAYNNALPLSQRLASSAGSTSSRLVISTSLMRSTKW